MVIMVLRVSHLAIAVFTIDDLHAAELPTRDDIGRAIEQLSLGRAALLLKRISPPARLARGLIGLVVLLCALVDAPRSSG